MKDISPLQTRSDASHPLVYKKEGIRLVFALLTALRTREKRLPEPVLDRYLEKISEKREIFLESALRFGTPQYFYDHPALMDQIDRFHDVFSKYLPRFRTFYAMKSNPFKGIIRDIVASGMGLDVSSGYELSQALDSDCKDILFSGPGKTCEELAFALKKRDRIILLMDSSGELERLSELHSTVKTTENPLKVGIRVQCTSENTWNKFGIPLRALSVMLEKASNTPGIMPCGIQFHTSWNLSPGRQAAMIRDIGAYLNHHLSGQLRGLIQFLDIGGGFWPEQGEWFNFQHTPLGKLAALLGANIRSNGVHYYRPSSPLEDFAKNISRSLLSIPPPLRISEIFMEPGRWISTPSMHILLRVIDRKDERTVITDGGINLLGWERPLSEFIPVINLTNPSKKEQFMRIYGSLCTPDDIWGTSIFGNPAVPGDVLLVPDQGAYTYSLRQTFIKTIGKVVKYDGFSLKKVEKEKRFYKSTLKILA